MNIFLKPEEEIEIKPVKESQDKSQLKLPTPAVPNNKVSDLQKEMAAIDAMSMTQREAARIHGVAGSSVTDYVNGKDMNADVAARVLARKYKIQDVAVTKLMDTLDILDPDDMKNSDKIALINGLGKLIGDVSSKNDTNKPAVQLIIYAPTQAKEADYKVIDV